MQVVNRLIPCILFLLCGRAAALSDEECAAYHELRSLSDYETFAEDCAGKRVLGFDAGISNKFYAGNMEQKDFNRVFANAEEVSFVIYIENTEFTNLRMPKLRKLKGLSIRNNLKLKQFLINRGMTFDRSNDPPTTVTVDGNPVLSQESYEALRHLCNHCDIFEWSKCSALDQITEADYQDLVNKCAGEHIIKQKPGARFYLNANKLSEEQFAALFSQATHVQMCINFHDMPWKSITFPKLVRLIPCGFGDPSLDIVHNYYLTSISLPSYDSEGYGRLNQMQNLVLKNNFILPPEILQSFKSNCRFCKLLQYKECDDLKSSSTRNATNFVDKCGGKRIMWPLEGHILRLDISRLSQQLVDELFADVEKFKMCITLRNSQIRRLRMPKLKEMHSCEPGRPALEIEGITLEEFYLPPGARFPGGIWVYKGILPDDVYGRLNKECDSCVIERDTRCGFGSGYTSPQELLSSCMGMRRIQYPQELVLTETQLQQLCANAAYLKMCITIQNTSFRKISCPYLRYIEPCREGKSVFTVIQNPYLIEFDIPETVTYPANAYVFTVKKNMRLPKVVIDKLKRICPHCDIEAYVSKCGAMEPITNVVDFIKRCVGQPFIFPAQGVGLEVDLTELPEEQLNALFSEVIEMQICIRIKESQIRRLSFPKLTKWTPCAPGKPSLDLSYNFELREIDFPSCREGCVVGARFQYNPRVPKRNLNAILSICDQCTIVEYVPFCGLAPGYSMLDFVRACAGQQIIIPEGEPLVIDARKMPEELLNLFLSRVVYMEVCIVMTATQYRSLSAPYLREVKPCQSGMPVFTITKNPYLAKIVLPERIRYPPQEKLFLIRENLRLTMEIIERLKRMCPHCEIEGFYSKCSGIGTITSVAQFIRQCIGQPIISPAPTVILEIDISNLPEEQINALFAEVVEMQICITISQSWIRRLSFPKLERWLSCANGRPALTLKENFELEFVTFPKCEVGCVATGEIRMNPKLKRPNVDKLLKYFMQVIYEEYVPSCGLGIGGFTDVDFVAACAGKSYIKPEGVIITIDARKIPETAMEAFCSKAVYMEVCIIMSETDYRSFRCPHLRYIRPSSPGTPVFTIIHNPFLRVIEIPPNVQYPSDERIMRVTMNRLIPVPIIAQLKKICPHCEITGYFSKCSALGPITDVGAFLMQCAGQPLIAPQQGVVLEVDLSLLTDEQINRLFSEVVEMQICITIERSQIRTLEFPKLISWETCAPGRRPLTIRFTQLKHLRFPKCKRGCMRNALIDFNWLLPRPEIEAILIWCENCQVRHHEISCGLTGRFSMIDFVRACAGRELIISDRPIIIHSDNVTETEMNAFCSRVVYMQACIIISASNYKQFRCPNLEEVKPCRSGVPVFTIINNMDLQIVEIPVNVIFPSTELLVEIYGNPDLPPKFLDAMKKRCPRCRIEAASACGLTATEYTDKELAQACAGKTIIRPAKGFYLTISSRYVTEVEMNMLCSRAVHMEICIIITESHFRSLRCPYLKVLKPCLPDRPAIMIVDNPFFEALEIPTTTTYPPGFPIIKIGGNPTLHPKILTTYRQWCRHCDIQPDYACGITRPQFTVKELVTACAGRKYIKPAPNVILIVTSKDIDEEQLNRMCSRAVYMEICIDIIDSDFKMLKCPNLKELRPCQPGRPAIRVINNRYFQTLYIPPGVIYPENYPIIEIYNNPSLDPSIIPPLKLWCKHCRIDLEYACGIRKKSFTIAELIAACTGHEYIRPPPGMLLIITANDIPEEQLLKLLENAVYVEMCIEIKRSTFRRLRMPNLKEIRPCQPGRPAILLEFNAYMEEVLIPPTATYPRGEEIIRIQRLPSLPYTAIVELQRWCPHCSIIPDFVCGISKKPFTLQQVLSACTGQEFIMSSRGVTVVIKSSQITEEQMNELVARAKVMKICIEITRSRYRKLVIPKLRELLPCTYGRPAIKIVDNPYFVTLDMPPRVRYPKDVAIVEIQRNPHFDIKILEILARWCPHCTISGDYACGLNKPDPSAKELMAACAGKRMLVPMPGYMIIIHSDDFTEPEFNAFCSKMVQIQACITIEKSTFRKIRCPMLKELIPCKPGMPALKIVENFNLIELVIPQSLLIPEGVILFEVRDNPRLPITILEMLLKLCPGCRISFDADCGLTRPFTLRQLIKACAGKVVIRPSIGHTFEFPSDKLDEAEMNALCSQAGYIEACIIIVESNYRSFQCPHLRELHPCAPGRVAITVEDNSQLTQLFIPISIAYPRGAIILQLSGNPLLPYEIVDNYRTRCRKACRFPKRNACILQARDYRDKELISQCAGKSVIKPQRGFKLIIDSRQITPRELNALCAKATVMEICIIIKGSMFKDLICPVLKEIRSCKEGTPAIQIINNIDFAKFTIPKYITWPRGTIPYLVYGNPKLTPDNILILQQICPQCKVSADYDCGLTRPFTVKQFVAACVGKKIIRPTPGHLIEFTVKGLTEAQMNAFCHSAVYMEVCITMTNTNFESFRCPHLKELRPCAIGRAALTIYNNKYLKILEFPKNLIIIDQTMLRIYDNPVLSETWITRLKLICKNCRFPSSGVCNLEPRAYSDKELVAKCAGKSIIRPRRGFALTLHSKYVTEEEMNAFCAKATVLEICITIEDSSYTALRCPRLKQLIPCQPGMPAIRIINNLHFSILEIPRNLIVPKEQVIFEISENPHISLKIITTLKRICPWCHKVTANVACDLEGRHYSDKELVAACAGKRIIKPAPGWILKITSRETSEAEMNALCSKAVYMEICIEITRSSFKRLRCPYLKELRPCQPGRPAIKIVNNMNFENLELPTNVLYPRNARILEISEVPHMRTALIKKYIRFCRNCRITANLGCGLNKRDYSDAEMVAACAGKAIIKPAEGYMLVMNSDTVSEEQMNAVCSKAVFMEICIEIKGSQFRSLRCPHLRHLIPCQPGKPAIKIIGNPYLSEVSISRTLIYRRGTKTLEIRGNPMLSPRSLRTLKKLCPECIIRRRM